MGKTLIRRTLYSLALAVVVALAVGLYKAKTDAAQAEARVRTLRARIADTQADMRALRAEIARAESPANIEALAQAHLGLDRDQHLRALPEAALARDLPAPRKAEAP